MGRGAARTDLLGEGALLNVKGEGGGVVACTGLWGGGLTLSCSYRSVGGGSLVKCQRLGRWVTLMGNI